MPIMKYLNNSQELVIIRLILSLCKNYFLGEKEYWMLLSNFIRLGKFRLRFLLVI